MLFSVLSVSAFAAVPEESADPALTTEQTAAEEENCFFTSSSTEEEKEPNSITYVALGDSICAGIGLTTVQYAHNLMGVDVSFNFKGYPETCYVGQVGKSLNLDRDHAINLGLPGVMSKDMLELVKTGTMAEMNTLSGCQYNYPEFVDYIKMPMLSPSSWAPMMLLCPPWSLLVRPLTGKVRTWLPSCSAATCAAAARKPRTH